MRENILTILGLCGIINIRKGGDIVARKLTQDEFVAKANAVHNNRYDYSKTVYTNGTTKISIICSAHGEFLQRPYIHLQGQGCPECAKSQRKETCMKRYGASARTTETGKEKMKSTVRARYGVDCVLKSESVREKIKQTNLFRYGSVNAMQNKTVSDKAKQTNISKYGVPCAMQNEDVKSKHRLSMYQHCHVDDVADNPVQDILQKINRFDMFLASEDDLHGRLCQCFDSEDVIQSYASDVYPFSCAFYIKSRGLYVEFEHPDDAYALRYAAARRYNLNYIILRDLRDAELWLSLGCPDGHDWDRRYSWLPDKQLTNINIPALTGTLANLSRVAKAYQFHVFYRHEMQLWESDFLHRGMTLRAWLYHNRLKYIGKNPVQLSGLEILRGFTISGIYKGYTVFDSTLMDMVIRKYHIDSVYDPCAGWGERMLYCYCNDIRYMGVDINSSLRDGYTNMQADFGITDQSVIFADSSKVNMPDDFTAVVTCPPYGNTEIYSNDGAENLSKADFLKWWSDVVQRCSEAQYFCFQINRKWRDSMLAIVERNGYNLIDELCFIHSKSSHLTRRGCIDIKTERETMLVLRKS